MLEAIWEGFWSDNKCELAAIWDTVWRTGEVLCKERGNCKESRISRVEFRYLNGRVFMIPVGCFVEFPCFFCYNLGEIELSFLSCIAICGVVSLSSIRTCSILSSCCVLCILLVLFLIIEMKKLHRYRWKPCTDWHTDQHKLIFCRLTLKSTSNCMKPHTVKCRDHFCLSLY